MPGVLFCRGVTVRHHPQGPAVLENLFLEVAEGERVALVGLNGSGKTTLLRSLVGLLPHEGEITICGQALEAKNLAQMRRKVGFLFNVPEDQLLFPEVIEDVAFGLLRAGVKRREARERAQRSLEALGVGHLADQVVHHLSHGEKLRVALAGALVTEPPLLLLDEPTAGLDPPGALALAGLLRDVPSAQLIATHDLDFAERVCGRVVLLERGGISEEFESAAEVRQHWNLPRDG